MGLVGVLGVVWVLFHFAGTLVVEDVPNCGDSGYSPVDSSMCAAPSTTGVGRIVPPRDFISEYVYMGIGLGLEL